MIERHARERSEEARDDPSHRPVVEDRGVPGYCSEHAHYSRATNQHLEGLGWGGILPLPDCVKSLSGYQRYRRFPNQGRADHQAQNLKPQS